MNESFTRLDSAPAVTWKRLAPLTVVAVLLFWAYLRFNKGFAVDDSYITFRYAQNALAGHGFVFNVGQHYYGSTATGYAMLLAGIVKLLSFVGILVDIPQVSTFLSALSVAAIAWIAGRACLWSSALLGQVTAVATAMFIAVLPLSSSVSAHETYAFTAALAVGSYLIIMKRSLVPGALMLVLAMTLRPDSLLFVIIQFAGLLFAFAIQPTQSRYNFRQICTAAGIVLIGMLAWVVAMKLYYGTFFPGTMDAKKAQVQMGYWPLFNISTVVTALDQLFVGRYWLLLPVPALIAAYSFLRQVRARLPELAVSPALLYCAVWTLFALGVVCAYSVFEVTLWTWYVAPIGFGLLLSGIYGVNYVAQQRASMVAAATGAPLKPGAWATVILVFLLAVGLSITPRIDQHAKSFATSRNVNGHLTSYDPIMYYLKKHEPGGTSVAIAEPGTFGYKLGPDYQVLDVLGLASPGVAKALRAGDFNYTVTTWKPKYVVTSWQGKYNPDQQPGFSADYELVGEFREPYWDVVLKHGAMLYRRKGEASGD
jgi:hypothetical protein